MEARELGSDLGRGKEKLKGLARFLNPGSERIVSQLFEERKHRAWLRVVQSQSASRRWAAMKLRVARKASRVRYGTTPSQAKNAGACELKPASRSCVESDWRSKSTGA